MLLRKLRRWHKARREARPDWVVIDLSLILIVSLLLLFGVAKLNAYLGIQPGPCRHGNRYGDILCAGPSTR